MRRLSDILDESPDAFLPDLLRGQLVEAEHFVRYAWAAQFVSGRSALDVGCGVAWGTRMLAAAGATEVVGVDSVPALLEMADLDDRSAVRLVTADVRALPLESGSIDVVVALGLLEQMDEPGAALTEMLRVLGEGGLIIVSASATDRQAEAGAESVRAAIGGVCKHTVELRQQNWTMSAIMDEQERLTPSGDVLQGLSVRKLVASRPGSEIGVMILGSRGRMPEIRAVAATTHAFAHERWLAHNAEMEARLADRARLERELQDARRDRAVLADRLIALEQQIARSAEH